ncbi:hypothetical protein EIP91_003632 [Steccherinum ochraceum]|uniref:Uncharacterized protein n=1 Tax=Steccherinum ochraceum TaxID=92696 RepID=A0A4R0RBL0_9APHY|nr:hypothetical protein EIP91_003632 [Steccherinum ochraceum]
MANKAFTLFLMTIVFAAAALLPASAAPIPGQSLSHAKRLVDYDCTFLPDDQKPARCADGTPLIPPVPKLAVSYRREVYP